MAKGPQRRKGDDADRPRARSGVYHLRRRRGTTEKGATMLEELPIAGNVLHIRQRQVFLFARPLTLQSWA
jgi:hypothetical protein